MNEFISKRNQKEIKTLVKNFKKEHRRIEVKFFDKMSGITSCRENSLLVDNLIKDLYRILEQGFNNLHKQLGLSAKHKQTISSMWVNDGSDNVAIEAPHRHVDGILSAVYWPIADTNCAPLTFINPNNQMSYVFKSTKAKEVLGYRPIYTVDQGIQKSFREYEAGVILPAIES